jgi:CBS domain containing-hemolysin-like protein
VDTVDIGLVAALVVCFVGVAGLAVAEVAVLRVRRSRVTVAAGEDAGARRLLHLLDDLPVTLNSILLLALLLQVSTATIGGYLAQRWFGGVGVTAATVVITAVLFLYAEAIPKTMAIRSPLRMARLVTPVLTPLVGSFRPLVRFLVWLADEQTPGVGAQVSAFSEEELRTLAREAAEAGVIEEADARLVDRSFEFGDRRVGEIMVEREAIVSVGADQGLADALATALQSGHSRLPILGDGLDDVIGVVRLRDVAMALQTEPGTGIEIGTETRAMAPVASVATPPLRTGPGRPIAPLLRRMQADNQWLAIVEDDRGRTIGLITVEDVVAELVGEIAEDRDEGPDGDPDDDEAAGPPG